MSALGALAGCTSSSDSKNVDGEESERITPDETMDCDIVVVGGGVSGLSAALQAGQNGSSTVLLESTGFGGLGVEGVFAVDSGRQKELGIHIDPCEILVDEISYSQNRSNALLWMDLIKNSADNYEWLVENGVEFSGVVDDYGGGGPQTMHWFKGFASDGYVPPMKEAATKAGVQVLQGYTGKELVIDNGVVKGIIAQKDDKSYVQFNAPVVILATGGFASNTELIAELGYNMDYLRSIAPVGRDGDGYTMALQAGGGSTIGDTCALSQNTIIGIEDRSQLYYYFFSGGPYLWVNEKGERFCSEDTTSVNFMAGTMPTINQSCTYTIFSKAIFTSVCEAMGYTDAPAQFDTLVRENKNGNIFECETLKDVASQFDLDTTQMTATIDRYNELCAAGKDADYGKPAQYMVALDEGPFYIARLEQDFVASIGGIRTNRDMEVVKNDKTAIPGLYAIGIDGCMLYRDVYTINIPATCCGHNVNSGRVAANKALEYIAST